MFKHLTFGLVNDFAHIFCKVAFFILCFPLCCLSQKVENLKAEAQGEKIIVTYDLVQGHVGEKYSISLFSAHNNFSSAVKNVTGEVGDGITEGKGKRIVWDAKSELVNYKGQLSFEVHAEVILPLAFLKASRSIRRGKKVPITWTGGNKKQDVKVELLKKGAVNSSLSTVANKGIYEWKVPKHQKTGGDYQVRLTNGKETITTGPFSIKHRTPFIVKMLPLIAAAAVLSLGSGGKSNGTSPSSYSAPKELADPPDLGLN